MKVITKLLMFTILISLFLGMFFHNESFAVPDYGEPGSYNTAFSIELVCESLENYEVEVYGDYGYETRVYSEDILDEDFYVKIASLVDMGETIETSSFGVLNYVGTEEIIGRHCYIYTADITDKTIFDNKIIEDLRYPEYNFKFYYEISLEQIKIEVKDINNLTVEIDTSNKEYIGQKIELDIVIKDGIYTLLEGEDYIVEYSNNIDVGLAIVTIDGTGNYKGSIMKFFEIIHNDKFFSGGTGTPNDPYLISTPLQLYGIKDELTASYKLINDIDLTYDTTNENGLFYNDGAGWISIGGTDGVFSGTLDGNNKKIIGFNQRKKQTTDNVFSCGLFVNSSAIIKDLTLEKINIIYDCNYKNSAPYYTQANIGTISAYFTGKLENIVTSGTIKINKEGGSDDLYASVGGLFGVLRNGEIKNCKSSVNIETNCLGNVSVGGIAGTIDDSKIEMTENKGELINGYVGGIANHISNSELKKVKNYGTITAISGRGNSVWFI